MRGPNRSEPTNNMSSHAIRNIKYCILYKDPYVNASKINYDSQKITSTIPTQYTPCLV